RPPSPRFPYTTALPISETFRGYPPETGWDFLVDAIVRHDYGERGIKLTADEIVVSDGAKSDTGNIQEIFGPDCVVALSDPVYPRSEEHTSELQSRGHLV